jgi:mannose-6-phosphate isomerase-like protein (cupin superfamily)
LLVGESFVIAEWSDPGTHPGRPIAPLHLHRSDDEAWFVLEGRLGFKVGDEQRELSAGESLLVARGTPHWWWNPAPKPTRYLLVMTPRIHHLIEALHADGREHYPAIFEAHDSELLTA